MTKMEVIENDESEVCESIQIPPETVADVPQTPLPDEVHRHPSLIT